MATTIIKAPALSAAVASQVAKTFDVDYKDVKKLKLGARLTISDDVAAKMIDAGLAIEVDRAEIETVEGDEEDHDGDQH